MPLRPARCGALPSSSVAADGGAGLDPAEGRDRLAEAREALARHDWQRCHDATLAAVADDDRAEADRLDLLAEAAWWLGRLDECIDAREGAYRLFEQLGDQRRAGQCAVWLYEHNCQRARPAIGSAWLRRARRALDAQVESVEHAALLLREVELLHGDGQLDLAAELAERAHELGRRLGSADVEAEALQAMGRVLIDSGQPHLGLAHLDEAMLLAVEGRLGPYSTGKVYCSLIGACEELGDLRRAAEWTDATGTWARQHPFAIFPGICRIHRAVVLDRRGDLVDAEREASRACTELLASHVPNAAAAFAEVGDIRRRIGDLVRAEEAFRRAEELSGRTCVGTALLRLAQGRVDEASRIVAGCLAEQAPSRLARARLLPAAVQVAIAAGDLAGAEASARELDSIADAYDTPLLRAISAVARGRFQLARRDAVAASVTLRDALRRWQELGVPYEVATARTVYAQALRDAGDERAAQESFATARALFDEIGVRLEAQVGEQVDARRLPGGLTEREAEVLRHVAEGLSNKEIAARLHLSVKTVSRHLSNIFTKIGVSSRAAATAFAFEHHLARGRP